MGKNFYIAVLIICNLLIYGCYVFVSLDNKRLEKEIKNMKQEIQMNDQEIKNDARYINFLESQNAMLMDKERNR